MENPPLVQALPWQVGLIPEQHCPCTRGLVCSVTPVSPKGAEAEGSAGSCPTGKLCQRRPLGSGSLLKQLLRSSLPWQQELGYTGDTLAPCQHCLWKWVYEVVFYFHCTMRIR